MSSHLAISYSPNAAASRSSAASGATASTAGDGLGFLGALIDQLLASDAGEATSQITSAVTSVADTATVPATTTASSSDVEPATQSQLSKVPEGLKLLSRLASELRGLQLQLSAGENPDADQLQMLDLTLDRLSEILGFSLTTGQSTSTATADTDTDTDTGDDANSETATDASTLIAGLAAISSGLLASGADDSTTTDTNTTNSATAATTGDTSDVQSAFANLTKALDAASAAITALSPALAQKLAAFADQLGAVEADPQTLVALAGTAEDPAAAVSTALAKLTKPLHLFSEFAPLLQLSHETPLPAPASTGSTSTSTAEADAEDEVAVTTTRPDTRATDSASAPKTGSSSDTPSQSTGDALTATATETADPEPAKADTGSASQSTSTDAPSGAVTPATTQSRALPAAYQPVASPINMGQLAFEMVHQVQKGLSRFSIRLDPAELGRIDVRMSVDQGGTVTAHLTVDRAETLDLFQRDRSTLERALSQAGLESGKTSLEFSLRQNPAGTNGGGDNRQASGTTNADTSSTVSTDGSDTVITLYRGAVTARGVNILA